MTTEPSAASQERRRRIDNLTQAHAAAEQELASAIYALDAAKAAALDAAADGTDSAKARAKVAKLRSEVESLAESRDALAARLAAAQAEHAALSGAEQVEALEAQYMALHAERKRRLTKAHGQIREALTTLAEIAPEGRQFARQAKALVPGFGSFLADFTVPESGGLGHQIEVLKNEAQSIATATGCNPFQRIELASALARQGE